MNVVKFCLLLSLPMAALAQNNTASCNATVLGKDNKIEIRCGGSGLSQPDAKKLADQYTGIINAIGGPAYNTAIGGVLPKFMFSISDQTSAAGNALATKLIGLGMADGPIHAEASPIPDTLFIGIAP